MNRSGRSEAKSREVDEHGEAERSPAGDDVLTAKLEAGDLAFAQSGPEHGLRWCRMGAHLSGLVQSGSAGGPGWRPRAARSSSEHADRSDTGGIQFRENGAARQIKRHRGSRLKPPSPALPPPRGCVLDDFDIRERIVSITNNDTYARFICWYVCIHIATVSHGKSYAFYIRIGIRLEVVSREHTQAR